MGCTSTFVKKKYVGFEWFEECQKTMEELKKRLTYALVYTLLNDSIRGMGCVLIQSKWIASYTSRQLRRHKKKYLTHDPKLAVIVLP